MGSATPPSYGRHNDEVGETVMQLAVFALGPWSVVRVGDVATHLLSVAIAQDESAVHEAPMLHTSWFRNSAPTPAQPVNR